MIIRPIPAVLTGHACFLSSLKENLLRAYSTIAGPAKRYRSTIHLSLTLELPNSFKTLHNIDDALQSRLFTLVSVLEKNGYDADEINEHLLYLLRQLIHVHNMEAHQAMRVSAIKQSTKTEVYKRLCSAKDVLHSSFMNKL